MSAEQAGGTPGSGAMSDRMRALLSRAAEEQLLEQRQVSAVLGDLRALVQDLDERLATGAQVELLAAQVREVSTRLDRAEARSAELTERIADATAVLGRAAQDLVGAVVTGVVERVEAQLHELTAGTASSVQDVVAGSERRLATHVDDAVLALAEVVLRRRSAGTTVAAPAPPAAAQDDDAADRRSADEPPVSTVDGPPAAQPSAHEPASSDVTPPVTSEPSDASVQTSDPRTEPSDSDTGTGTGPSDGDTGTGAEQSGTRTDAADPVAPPAGTPATDLDEPARVPADADGEQVPALPDGPPVGEPLLDLAGPGADRPDRPDGFVLVPADVEEQDAGPAPPAQRERRVADRRTSDRSDGSGRRRRPWWRPV